MYYQGYNNGYSYGSPCCGTPGFGGYQPFPCNTGFGSGAAIVLVLFILLVIVLGARHITA